MSKLPKTIRKKARLKKLARARREFEIFETKTRELARNTVSAAGFIAETVRAESRHFAAIAVAKVTGKLMGSAAQKPRRDSSLDPLSGLPSRSGGVMDDPMSHWS